MPKIKTCPHCNEVLVCQACKTRFTPEFRRNRSRLTDLVNQDLIEKLRTQAREEGVSINVVLARHLEKEQKNAGIEGKQNRKPGRKLAAADQP